MKSEERRIREEETLLCHGLGNIGTGRDNDIPVGLLLSHINGLPFFQNQQGVEFLSGQLACGSFVQ